jgi:hypothetical protein
VEVAGSVAHTLATARRLLPIPTTQKALVSPRKEHGGIPTLVEVAGIEPASFVALMGLLRAQCAVSLLGPTDHAHKSV